jgi:5-methylcytosine-specific restriction protein A
MRGKHAMSRLSEIVPKDPHLIIDLARDAGVNVSDWGNFKGGKRRAASNPKYCYEWSFVEPKKVIVLNMWYASMEERDGTIVQNFNMREVAREFGQIPGKAVWGKRALRMDLAIQEAVRDNLPVRVVVLEGAKRGVDQPKTEASRVEKRLLDPVTWAVTNYDWSTGHCTVTRGAHPDRFADQFSIPQELEKPVEQRTVSGHVFVRNPDVRRRVLQRAKGKCEWCAEPGFIMADGRVYLETHHVIPLAERGSDTEGNVVALCPNHHREAHHGANSSEMRKTLLKRQNRRTVIDAKRSRH